MEFINICRLLTVNLIWISAQLMPQMPFQFVPQAHQIPSLQMPQGLPGPLPLGVPPPNLPNLPHMPGVHPPMLMPSMQFPINGGRLPMVVRPHYSKKKDMRKSKKNNKKYYKRNKAHSSEIDDSSDTEDYEIRSKNHFRSAGKKRQEVLTPVVSYVTKDGYVIYQKKIKKEKAKDWLELASVQSEEFVKPRSRKRHEH